MAKQKNAAAQPAAQQEKKGAKTPDTVEETVQDTATAAIASELEAKLAAAEQQVADAEGKLDEAKNSLLRTAAEYENFRKRSQKEHEMAFGNGVSCAACELLPVIDVLDAAANAETTDEEYKKGVLLTLAKCQEAFGKLGIYEIEALGLPFDPELHNAVMQDPVEGAESGTVTKVLQKGYRLGDKVIRHSMVGVAP